MGLCSEQYELGLSNTITSSDSGGDRENRESVGGEIDQQGGNE